jgi:BirA family biotin operon repressor/biotin-[acetyl-CoA-carboxylase] ligase
MHFETRHFDSLPSTNDLAKEMAARGAAEGTTIVARQQTAGRGRFGRTWVSPAGQGLYVSVVLRPQSEPRFFSGITLAAAVAVAETLAEPVSGKMPNSVAVVADIKWPNDIMLSGKKACGILVETATEANRIEYAVVGLGVNLGQPEFPEELRETATSVLIETGRLITPEEFLSPLLHRLAYWYQTVMASPGECFARWEQLSSYGRECEVVIVSADGAYEGVTKGLTGTGSLIVELPSGQRREIVSGEVTLRRRTSKA